MEEIIRIKDKRKGVFTVDNVVMNGYGRALGATGIAFYVTLCRYANRETQQAYPSLTLIQNETDMHRETIIGAAKKAEKLGLIKRKALPGKYTVYTLLEPRKRHWSEIDTGKGKKGLTGRKSTPTGRNLTPLVGNRKRTNEEERMKNTGGLKNLKETVDKLGLKRSYSTL